MKLLFITNLPSPYRVDFFNELGKSCELTVCYERKSASDRDEKWKGRCAENYTEIYADCKPKGADQSTGCGIVKILKSTKFDQLILTGYSSPSVILGMIYCKLHGISFHMEFDGGMYRSESLPKRLLKKLLINSASNILTTCDEHIRYLSDIGISKSKLHKYPFSSLLNADIPEGIPDHSEKQELRKLLGISEPKMLLSVGRFIPGKGYDILLKAACELSCDIGIFIVGGTATEEYLTFTQENNLTNVHFVDFMDKDSLKKWYRAADCFVLPTRSDVWGLVINEAMAQGLPVVTTDKCNAGLELVENEKNGYIVPVDDVKLLVKAVCDVFSADTHAMGVASYERIKGYTIETMAQAHINYFNDLNDYGE